MFWDNAGQLPANDPRLDAPLQAVSEAVVDIGEQIAEGEVSEEEPISQRLAQAVRDRIKGLPEVDGVYWNARVVTPKKHTESKHGTDLAIWVEIDLMRDPQGPEYRAKKTVLIQAKRPDKLASEMAKLREQVTKMKEVSEAAGVFVVGEGEMWAADADDVGDDVTAGGLSEVGRPIPEFFGALLRCQVGDHQWDSAAEVRDALEARTYLMIDGFQRRRRRPGPVFVSNR